MTRSIKKASNAAGKRQPVPKKSGSNQNGGSALLSPAKLKQLYSTMLRCRLIEEKARLLEQDKLAKKQRAAAQREASEVGAVIDLLPGDFVAPRRRDLASSFVLGVPLKQIFIQSLTQPAGNPKV